MFVRQTVAAPIAAQMNESAHSRACFASCRRVSGSIGTASSFCPVLRLHARPYRPPARLAGQPPPTSRGDALPLPGDAAHAVRMGTAGRMAGGPPRPTLLTPAFISLVGADLAYFTAAGAIVYALPRFATGPIGAGTDGAGVAFGAFAISALLLRPVAGRLTDAYGRRPLMVGGALLFAVTAAVTAHAGSLALLIALRLLQGVAEAAFFVASFAALADLAPADRLGEALSIGSLGLYAGLAVGPLIGQAVADLGGLTAAWYAAAALAGLCAAVVWRLVGETRPVPPGAKGSGHFIHRPGLPAAVGFLAALSAMGGFLALVVLYAEHTGLQRSSLPLTVYGVVVVAGRIAFARIADRYRPLVLGAVSLGILCWGLLLIALWEAPAGLLVGTVVLAVGVTICTPAFFSAIFATARPQDRGAASATASACVDLGLGIGPILLGVVAESLGFAPAFAVAGAVAAAGAAWTLRLAVSPARRRGETGRAAA